MKFKEKSAEKPWEKVSIDEIQPYPHKYTQMIVLSYIFVAFFIFENTNFLGIPESYLSIIKIFIYGLLAFTLLYLYTDGKRRKMLNEFTNITLVLMGLLLIINVIIFGIKGLDWLMFPGNVFEVILNIINGIFIGLTILLGPVYLMYMSHHPKPQKNGYIITVIFTLFIILSVTLHI